MEDQPRINLHRANEFLNNGNVKKIKIQFMDRMVTIIIAGLGLITVLAWDRTLEDIFTAVFGPLDDLSRKIMYALLITLLAAIASVLLGKFFIREKRRSQE